MIYALLLFDLKQPVVIWPPVGECVVRFVHVPFVLQPYNTPVCFMVEESEGLTKYAPLPGVRSRNAWICWCTCWYSELRPCSVLL